MITFKKETKRY